MGYSPLYKYFMYKYRNNNYLKKVSTVYLVFFILKILVLNINYNNNNNNKRKSCNEKVYNLFFLK